MGNFASNMISVLQYLIPGFITAWIFYSFTSHAKPSQFERVVQALVFTFIIHMFVSGFEYFLKEIGNKFPIMQWNDHIFKLWSVIISVLIGFILVYFNNNDKVHKYLRSKGITHETTFHSVWLSAFQQHKSYIVLHFMDGRRLRGWPIEWPAESENEHFLIEQPAWFQEKGGIQGDEGNYERIRGVFGMLVDTADIRWVEFLEEIQETKNGEKSTYSDDAKAID